MKDKLLLTSPSSSFQCSDATAQPDPAVLAKCDLCYTQPCQVLGFFIEEFFA